MSRALVTGAAGFVGSHLCEALAARGDSVLGVDCFTPYYARSHKDANAAAARRAGAEIVDVDLRNADIAALLGGVDVVFHQAAQPGVRLSWHDGFGDYVAHNVLATQRLLEAARETAVRRFVYASSSSVYGNQPRYPVRETDVPAPFSPYGVTKLAAEHLCTLYAANWGVPAVSLRYFTVIGPRQRPDMAVHRLCEAALGRAVFPLYGDGSAVREFTSVADIVAGNLAAGVADVAPGTVVNLAGGAEITVHNLVALVGELAGALVPVESHDPLPGDSARNGGSIERAHQLLGWEPKVTLRDAVAAQLEWHRGAATSGEQFA